MTRAFISPNNSIIRYTDDETGLAPPGWRELPVEDIRPAHGTDETLDGPAVVVLDGMVRRVWTARPLTYDERLAACHADRRAAYPPVGDQLDALARVVAALSAGGTALPPEAVAWLAEVARVKATYPKPLEAE